MHNPSWSLGGGRLERGHKVGDRSSALWCPPITNECHAPALPGVGKTCPH
jgi:hypothetical protein